MAGKTVTGRLEVKEKDQLSISSDDYSDDGNGDHNKYGVKDQETTERAYKKQQRDRLYGIKPNNPTL